MAIWQIQRQVIPLSKALQIPPTPIHTTQDKGDGMAQYEKLQWTTPHFTATFVILQKQTQLHFEIVKKSLKKANFFQPSTAEHPIQKSSRWPFYPLLSWKRPPQLYCFC